MASAPACPSLSVTRMPTSASCVTATPAFTSYRRERTLLLGVSGFSTELVEITAHWGRASSTNCQLVASSLPWCATLSTAA